MRYTVETAGQTVVVRVEQGARGLEVAVGDGPLAPAAWVPVSGALHSLEWGQRRAMIRTEADPLEPQAVKVTLPGRTPLSLLPQDERTLAAAAGRAARPKGPSLQRSAMPGVIVEVHVAPGDTVKAGQILLILEAMKMQNEIKAAAPGVVAAVHVAAGDSVPAGAKLLEFKPAE